MNVNFSKTVISATQFVDCCKKLDIQRNLSDSDLKAIYSCADKYGYDIVLAENYQDCVVLNCNDNIYAIGTTDICAEGMAFAAIEAECVSDCDEGFVRNYAQEILTGLINKAIESSRSYGAFTIKEPEFDITIVGK